jgi:uncharacterized protein YecE (DUF72 family)
MLFAGSPLDRAPGRKYVAALRFAELSLRAPLPRVATLAGWRAGLPKDFAMALRAPRAALTSKIGPLRSDAATDAALATTLEFAKALEVRALVLPTPSDLAPGARSRELLKAFVAKLPRVEGRHYVWAPSGVWEPEEIDAVCEEVGLVRAFDPLQTPTRPAGEFVYAELRALGHRSGFSLAALDDALSVITSEETTEAFVNVDSPRGFDVAKRLTQLAIERGIAVPAAVLAASGRTPHEAEDGAADEGEDDESLEDDEEYEDGEDEDDDDAQ